MKLRRIIAGIIMSIVIMGTLPWQHAQAASYPMQFIDIQAGDIFELTVDTTITNPSFSWILTKDHRFLTAQRTRFFQTRQTLPGTYLLDVNIQNGMQTAYYAFTINVIAHGTAPAAHLSVGEPLKAVIDTQPAAVNGIVHLPPGGGLLKIDPSQSQGEISQYQLDIDNAVDSDRDGNPLNDANNVNTFSEQSGTPIYIYMLPGSTGRKVTLTVRDASGAGAWSQTDIIFDARSDGTASQVIAGQNNVIRANMDGSTVSFVIADPSLTQPGSQLLYEWNFGDKTQSLLDHPVHTYAMPGQYTVSLTVRDMRTGIPRATDTAVFTVEVPVQTLPSSSASSVSSSGSQSSSAIASGVIGSSTSWISILQVIGIILVLLSIALGLYFLLHWFKRLTAGSLQKKLETMEEKMFAGDKSQSSDVLDAAAVPLQIKKEAAQAVSDGSEPSPQEVIDREMSHKEFNGSDRTAVSPIVDSGPVPQWLAQTTPDSSPEQGSSTSEQTAMETAPQTSTPQWLKPAGGSDDAQAPSTSPSTIDAVHPLSTNAAQANTVNTSQPAASESKDAVIPDWLKTSAPAQQTSFQETATQAENDRIRETETVPPMLDEASASETSIDQPPASPPDPVIASPETATPSTPAVQSTFPNTTVAQEEATQQPTDSVTTEEESEQLPDWMLSTESQEIPPAFSAQTSDPISPAAPELPLSDPTSTEERRLSVTQPEPVSPPLTPSSPQPSSSAASVPSDIQPMTVASKPQELSNATVAPSDITTEAKSAAQTKAKLTPSQKRRLRRKRARDQQRAIAHKHSHIHPNAQAAAVELITAPPPPTLETNAAAPEALDTAHSDEPIAIIRADSIKPQ